MAKQPDRPPGRHMKRGRLNFTEDEDAYKAGPSTPVQVRPKPNGEEREKPSSRLRTEGRQAGEDTAAEDTGTGNTGREEGTTAKEKKSKQEKRFEKTQAKAERAGEKLNASKEKLAAQKPPKPDSLPKKAVKAAGAGTWAYGHKKIHEVEQENVGTEGAHKTELLAEAGLRKTTRYAKRRIREHPARQVEKWQEKSVKANANLHYQQMAQEHPELSSNPLSRFSQKWKLKRQYARQARETARQGARAAKETAVTTEKLAARAAGFVKRHPVGVLIAIGVFLVFVIFNSILSGLPMLGNGMMNAVMGTSYTAEDEDILGANEDYTALENELKQEIANIESTHPGYDEYRYNVDEIGHNPYELTSYLIAKLRTYTRANVQDELRALFEAQYKLKLTEEVAIRLKSLMSITS